MLAKACMADISPGTHTTALSARPSCARLASARGPSCSTCLCRKATTSDWLTMALMLQRQCGDVTLCQRMGDFHAVDVIVVLAVRQSDRVRYGQTLVQPSTHQMT